MDIWSCIDCIEKKLVHLISSDFFCGFSACSVVFSLGCSNDQVLIFLLPFAVGHISFGMSKLSKVSMLSLPIYFI
ncbi:hypothetical protein AO371_1842 [Moraxella catarrhalis]|nr:hypothetical protein AO375_2025 [Moraxella catarrhalis]OAV22483.1 hypothetical protein AO371_1842 [Moraxella catarrhalis]